MKLIHPILGVRELEGSHAERLMNILNNGGWKYHVIDKPDPVVNDPNVNAPSIGNKGTSKRKESKDEVIKGNKPTE